MDMPTSDFVRAFSLADLRAKGRLVLHGRHSPILEVYDGGRVFALDNRCPHMGFPLDRGSVEDGILTCHWHHAALCFGERLHLRSLGRRCPDLSGRGA
jgi:nitrite reductase/ring-hydroxylating ferredoxin subunit